MLWQDLAQQFAKVAQPFRLTAESFNLHVGTLASLHVLLLIEHLSILQYFAFLYLCVDNTSLAHILNAVISTDTFFISVFK